MTDQDRNTLSLNLADSLAAYLLRDRVDKHGKPLIEHARRVAANVAHLSHEQRIAALLHDVVEGTAEDESPIGVSVIDMLFGRSVGNTIATLTRDPAQEYQHYIEIVALYPQARAIKLADLDDNLDLSRGPIEPSLRARYERARQLLLDQEEQERKVREERGNPTIPVTIPTPNGKS